MKYLKCLLFSVFFIPSAIIAQDFGFTQVLQSPSYYNPAFTGLQQNLRAGLQLRLQPLLGNAYLTVAGGADMGFPKINSGVGLLFTSANYGLYSSTSIDASYAYQFKVSSDAFLRIGINAGFFQRAYDITALDSNQSQNIVHATPFTPNFATGALYYNSSVYAGLSVYNITEPDQSIDGTPDSKLLRRYVGLAGGFFEPSGIILNPNILLVSQGTLFEAMPGISASLGGFTLGTALRIQANPNIESLNFLFGFTGGKIKFCYSYDLSLFNTGLAEGVHELSLVLQLNTPHDISNVPMIGFMRGAY